MKDIYNSVLELENELIGHRRILHQLAEVGMDLHETCAYVTKVLTSYGIETEMITQCGIVATIGPRSGKTLLLRADMDALPMDEENDLIYKSNRDNVAHTCGHDMHIAMLLVAAKILKEREGTLKGCVKLMFQPGEESHEGARLMIDAGILQNPTVDAAMALHVLPGVGETGTFLYKKGVSASGASSFRIDIKGKGGHGGTPEDAIDPILIGTHIYQALHTIISHEFSGVEPLVLTIGNFVANGAANIIPDSAYMEGTLRFFNEDCVERVLLRIKEMAVQTASMFGGKAKVTFLGTCPPLRNNDEMLLEVESYLKEEFSEDKVVEMFIPPTLSEDFAYILQQVPGVFVGLSAGSKDHGYINTLHHPEVMFDEDALAYGVSAFVAIAQRWLEDNNRK